MGTNILRVAGQFIHGGIPCADHSCTAFCPEGIKINNLVGYLKLMGHAQVHGRQVYPVFNGKVIVEKEAQKTNAFQANNNILLSDKATINTKPQLEIFADDVKCSHGCTIGQLDESAMFYLRSRGIPEKEARGLLMFAFSNNVLDSVKIPEIKQRITKLIAKKLGVNIGFEL